MAFDSQQARRTRGMMLLGAVVLLVVIVGIIVLTGGAGHLNPSASAGSNGSSLSGASSGQTSSSEQSNSTGQTATSDTAQADMSQVDENYGYAEKQLIAKYNADKQNPAALLNLANGYFDWGVAALNVAKTDSDHTHATDLFTKAIQRYDEYLGSNPSSKSVEVDRAICIFYTGDRDKAIATLEAFVAKSDNASFAPAWANLGMFYEDAGRTQDARTAYQKAIDNDSDDAYQVKSYAEERLANLDK